MCAVARRSAKMRIHFKGGVWKNSEDEILKAAVMKYGKNQWARIASLLVRKSAKQCKARWFEWLDPAIKKTAWTREEEEKLLHLAKIMPTAWRTIAPMIGRTAAQCLEHYEKLLDQAQRAQDGIAEGADGAGPSSIIGEGGARRLRPGDVDPAPESKPARPDPVDMDEDELEMLSEARARLANTKGKKAKRKAREKQLDVAKRLAQLQKRRELKAAGINLKPRRKNRREMDFATEIPFERAPVPGFYDTRAENERSLAEARQTRQVGKLLEKYQGKSGAEVEQAARKRDDERRKIFEQKNLPAALGLDSKGGRGSAPKSPPLKRARLSLPEPQVSDMELEVIAKANASYAADTGGGSSERQRGITDDLVPARNALFATPGSTSSAAASSVPTPRTSSEPWANVRQRQLQAIMDLNSVETPLVGGQNTPMPHLGLESGVTPAQSVLRTPNPLATPSAASFETRSTMSRSGLARAQKAKLSLLKETVQQGLNALPEPEMEYDFDLALPSASGDTNGTEGDKINGVGVVEDADDERKRLLKEGKQMLAVERGATLSSAALRGLPIPDEQALASGAVSPQLSALVTRDLAVLKVIDEGVGEGKDDAAVALAVKAVVSGPSGGEEDQSDGELDLARARRMVERECKRGEMAGAASVEDIKRALTDRDEALELACEWVVRSSGEVAIAESPAEVAEVAKRIQSGASSVQKMERKQNQRLAILFGGYEKRYSALSDELYSTWDELEKARRELACFESLAQKEDAAIPERIAELASAIQVERDQGYTLQQRHDHMVTGAATALW